MISAQQNQLITRIGPGTRCGALLRHYWQPAALVDELPANRPLKAVRIMGEDLVLFRDGGGGYGLIARQCPHRGADLCFGRLEDGGLRCAFHGWLFDRAGQCIETPAEPEDSRLASQIKAIAYPCVERNGIVFTYMGPGAPPDFPHFDCFIAPDSHVFAFKGLIECNWLQAVEVGIDPAHASYLHRFFEDDDPAAQYGRQFRDQADQSGMPITRVLREFSRPEIRVEETGYGLRLITLRQIDGHTMHVRVTNQVFPNGFTIPMSNEMTITQWHVPIDDQTNYWYALFTSFGGPVDKDQMRAQRLELYELPDYTARRNKSNDYGFSAEEQAGTTFTGMGSDINTHDQWAVESQGAVQDRTQEHLGRADIGIKTYRRQLLKAIAGLEAGDSPLARPENGAAETLRGPVAVDAVGPLEGWEALWTERDRARRSGAPWDARLEGG